MVATSSGNGVYVHNISGTVVTRSIGIMLIIGRFLNINLNFYGKILY